MIVDDHPLMRRGLAQLLANESDLEVCGDAADAAGAWRAVEAARPDLMIIDLSLRGSDGLEVIKGIRARYPAVCILVFSMHDEKLFAERTLRAGAMGYVEKQEPAATVLDAIREVLAGRVYLSRAMMERLLRQSVLTGSAPGRSPIDALSDRELEVLDLLGDGLGTPEIAERLHLSKKTVQSHREHVKRKLQLGNSRELLRYAFARRSEQG